MLINDMMLYDIKIPILILLFIIINTIILIKYKDNYNIKKKYLSKLNNIKNDNDIYKEISKLIRSYVSEETSINITTYTLEDIKRINNKELTKIMKKCYKAEFSKNYKPNINSMINEAKEFIISWK